MTSATRDLKRAIQDAQRQLQLLHEYRTKTIADVVTGKLNVCDAAARLKEHPDEPEDTAEPNDFDTHSMAADEDLAAVAHDLEE